MIYVILGMHKSGTTLVSKLLHGAGINMGEFDLAMGYDQGNQFEREEILKLNNRILRGQWEPSLEITIPKNLGWESGTKDEAKEFVKKFGREHNKWGFKDPRSCLTYHLWADILPTHKIIVVYRHPYEVLKHYKSVFSKSRYKILSVWTRYNKEIVSVLRKHGHAEYLIVNYESLMKNDDELLRLEKFIGNKIIDLRDMNMYRNKSKSSKLNWIDKIILNVLRIETVSTLKFLERHNNI